MKCWRRTPEAFPANSCWTGRFPNQAARHHQRCRVCAAKRLADNTLIVDPKTKGIANIVVYLKKAPDNIPAKVKTSKEKQVVFDQKNCRFEPHILVVRTDQEVLVKSDDPINHNTHTHPFVNEELNFIVKPKDREGFPIKYGQREFLPMPVNCDLHPHMKAYWVVVDHPYAR